MATKTKAESGSRKAETNPWACTSLMMRGCMTCSVDDRIQMVKESADVMWLIAALLWTDTQPTVIAAVKRRLRKVYAEQREHSRGNPEVDFKEAEVGQFYFWVYPKAGEKFKFHKRCLVLCDRDSDGDLRLNILDSSGEVKESYYAGSELAGKLRGPVLVPLR